MHVCIISLVIISIINIIMIMFIKETGDSVCSDMDEGVVAAPPRRDFCAHATLGSCYNNDNNDNDSNANININNNDSNSTTSISI